MRSFPLVILFIISLVLLPAGAVTNLGAGISSGPADAATPPQDAGTYISQAQAAVKAENWTRVLSITTKGLAYFPDNAELHCQQGYAFRKMGQYEPAVDTVSVAIRLDPKPVRYANRGYAYLALKNYDAALADADAGIALDGNYSTNYGVKALALQGIGRTTMGALAAVDTAISQSPDSAHYWQIKGRILADQRACDAARQAFEKSIALDPDYTLPWPGFGSAEEDLASLDSTCIPVTMPESIPPPTQKSPLEGVLAAAGVAVALLAFGIRK